MNKILLLWVSTVIILGSFTLINAKENNYVEIKKPFANIYEYLDPKSNILKQAKKGDFFELV